MSGQKHGIPPTSARRATSKQPPPRERSLHYDGVCMGTRGGTNYTQVAGPEKRTAHAGRGGGSAWEGAERSSAPSYSLSIRRQKPSGGGESWAKNTLSSPTRQRPLPEQDRMILALDRCLPLQSPRFALDYFGATMTSQSARTTWPKWRPRTLWTAGMRE